jgi:hypothetical protein
MKCPGITKPGRITLQAPYVHPSFLHLLRCNGHVNHLWLLGSVSDTSTHTVLCFMGCERNGVQYSQSATLPSVLGCHARCVFFLKGVGFWDLLGWTLGNHSLLTSLPSNTNWCFCCSPYPCWIPAMHWVWTMVILLSTQSEKVQGTFTPAWNVHLLSSLGWQEVCPARWHMPQLNMQPKRLQRENFSGVLSIVLKCSVRKVTCSL